MLLHQEWFNSFKSDDFGFFYSDDDKNCTIIRKVKTKIGLDDGGLPMLSKVPYVPNLRKNLISLGSLQANGYSLWLDGDRDIMEVRKGAMTVIRARRTADNIYELSGSTIMGDVGSVETDNDAIKL